MPLQSSRPSPCTQDVLAFVPSVECAFCFENIDMMSVPQRETHYEDHFSSMKIDSGMKFARDNDPPRSSSSSANATASSPLTRVKNKVKIRPFLKETDGFWYAAHNSTPPTSFTPGIISFPFNPQSTHQILISQRANSSHPSRVIQRSRSWKCQTSCTMLRSSRAYKPRTMGR